MNAKNLFDRKHYNDLQHFPNFRLLDGGDNLVIGTLGQPRLITANLGFRF